MASEQERAALSLQRGRQAGKMTDQSEKKRYIAESAGIDKNYEGMAQSTAIMENKQKTKDVMGSFQKGGTVSKTGNYKLHRGETVTPASYHEFRGPGDMLKEKTENVARSTAKEAGAYVKHGANGNSVRSGSAAIASHDKD